MIRPPRSKYPHLPRFIRPGLALEPEALSHSLAQLTGIGPAEAGLSESTQHTPQSPHALNCKGPSVHRNDPIFSPSSTIPRPFHSRSCLARVRVPGKACTLHQQIPLPDSCIISTSPAAPAIRRCLAFFTSYPDKTSQGSMKSHSQQNGVVSVSGQIFFSSCMGLIPSFLASCGARY